MSIETNNYRLNEIFTATASEIPFAVSISLGYKSLSAE